jgi:hypothetical protein
MPVALFTVASAFVFRAEPLRRFYGLSRPVSGATPPARS